MEQENRGHELARQVLLAPILERVRVIDETIAENDAIIAALDAVTQWVDDEYPIRIARTYLETDGIQSLSVCGCSEDNHRLAFKNDDNDTATFSDNGKLIVGYYFLEDSVFLEWARNFVAKGILPDVEGYTSDDE
jgi:hypothetical protein